MTRILWLNWSGGGNLPPSLGIARELTERGHEVVFAGRPEMVPRVERAGFRAIELTRAYEQAARYPNKWLPKAASYLTSPAVMEEIREEVEHPMPVSHIVTHLVRRLLDLPRDARLLREVGGEIPPLLGAEHPRQIQLAPLQPLRKRQWPYRLIGMPHTERARAASSQGWEEGWMRYICASRR